MPFFGDVLEVGRRGGLGFADFGGLLFEVQRGHAE